MYIKENKITFFLRNKMKLLVTLFIIKIIARTKLFFKLFLILVYTGRLIHHFHKRMRSSSHLVMKLLHRILVENTVLKESNNKRIITNKLQTF